MTANPRFADEAEQIKNCQFIQVVKVRDYKSVNLLCRATGLDIGESEAIVLSDDLKADLLLMDEAKGRDVAEQMQIICGNLGCILMEQLSLIGEECDNILPLSPKHINILSPHTM